MLHNLLAIFTAFFTLCIAVEFPASFVVRLLLLEWRQLTLAHIQYISFMPANWS